MLYYDYLYSPYDFLTTLITNYYFVIIIIGLIKIIALWKLFEKANFPGWASLIPIYNMIVLFEIAKLSPWYLLFFLVPFINIIAIPILLIILRFRLAFAFGKSVSFGFGLLFLSTIFLPILAFSTAKYVY